MYTSSNHTVTYVDGEIRQQDGNTYVGSRLGGVSTVDDKADAVCFTQPTGLDQYDIHLSMREQIGDCVAGICPHLG